MPPEDARVERPRRDSSLGKGPLVRTTLAGLMRLEGDRKQAGQEAGEVGGATQTLVKTLASLLSSGNFWSVCVSESSLRTLF